MSSSSPITPHGRGGTAQPANRFIPVASVPDYAHFDGDEEFFEELRSIKTQFLVDSSQSIISQNDSPDLKFRYSLNPYRGCEHGCAYCYRPPKHATSPYLRNLYRERTSGRNGRRGNRLRSTSKAGVR